jgi:autotransporter-associated beta strand protein
MLVRSSADRELSNIRRLGVAAVVVWAFCGPPAEAQTSWILPSGQVGDWSTATCWDSGVPTSGIDATIANGGTAQIISAAACQNLTLGTGTGGGTVQMLGGSLSSSGTQYVGNYGPGTYTQSGGTNTVPGGAYLFVGFRGSGTYNLTDTGSLSAAIQYVGHQAAGVFNQSGGTNNSTMSLSVGSYSGHTGTYNLSSGLLSAAREAVGDWDGTGLFVQTGGTNIVSGGLYLGYGYTQWPNASGSYSLSSGLLSAPSEYVGWTGIGSFTQTGGTNTCSSGLTLALNAGSNGTYNLNGGTLVASSLFAGSGTAAFNFGGGTLQAKSGFSTMLPMMLTGNGGNANVDTAGYAVTLSGPLSGPGGLSKLGSGTLTLTGPNAYNGVAVIKAGTLAVGPDAQNAVLTLGGADIQGGKLVLNYSGPSPTPTVLSILAASYAGGFAPGSGKIYGSTLGGLALGWADDGSSTVTVMPALFGDTTLDGKVDIVDLGKVLTNFDHSGMTWAQGDFTYDGTVDISDLGKILTNFDKTMGMPGASIKAVPEPANLVLLAFGLLGIFAGLRRL